MNIDHIKYYIAAVEYGSFEAAGRALFTSASSIARAVHGLEREYHITLTENAGTNAAPTEIGLRFYEDARHMLRAFERFESSAHSLSRSHDLRAPLRLAIAETPCRGAVVSPSALSEFKRMCGDVVPILAWAPSGVCLATLEEGLVDAAIVLGEVDRAGMGSVELCVMILALALSNRNPLALQGTVSIEELSALEIGKPRDLRYCAPMIDGVFRDHGIDPHYVRLGESQTEHANLLSTGGGFFVFRELEAAKLYPDAVFVAVRNAKIAIPIHLVFHSDEESIGIDKLQRCLAEALA